MTPDASSAGNVTDTYLAYAATGDRRRALELALDWAGRFSPASAIVELLVPAQVETGRRWQRDEWTVSDEHLVSGITDFVLAVVADRYRVEPSRPGRVTVVCAEGEWHSLAARVVAELLRLEGWPVDSLGPSTPAADVSAHLARGGTVAVAAHCSMTSNLPGLLGVVDAAHRQGVPVVVGGGAVTAERIARLGADGCDPGGPGMSSRVSSLLSAWAGGSTPALGSPPTPSVEYFELETHRPELVDRALFGVLQRLPDLAGLTAGQVRAVREELDHLVRFVAASVLMDEPAIIADAAAWLGAVFGARHFPAPLAAACAGGLLDALIGLEIPTPHAQAALRALGRA